MQTISCGNYKGGSGKSSAAIHLASTAACFYRRRTVIVDLDVQGSANNWRRSRVFNEPRVIQSSPDQLEADVRRLEPEADLCVLDVPGHDWTALARAAVLADLNVIVSRPTALDYDLAAHVVDALKRFGVAYANLLVQVPHRGSAKLDVWVEKYRQLGPMIPTMLTHLIAFQDAIAFGRGVEEHEPSGRAAAEVRATLDWILERLGEPR